jgi:hypothetical protein
MTVSHPISFPHNSKYTVSVKVVEEHQTAVLPKCCWEKEIMSGKVEDKQGNPIEVGDTVFTKIRGGKREGEVNLNSPSHESLNHNYGLWYCS